MEMPPQRKGQGCVWNSSRPPQYSKKTEDMLRLMMQEAQFTNIQRRKINEYLKKGAALPMTFEPSSLGRTIQTHKHKASVSTTNCLPAKPQRRSAESCQSGNSYIREKFRPLPTRDLEKEKRRLQNILATGQEEPQEFSRQIPNPEVSDDERDRHQEVLDEIAERRQFLADMAALGQEKRYFHIINAEISQKIRELEVMDGVAEEPEC